jgi:hypothetical protein
LANFAGKFPMRTEQQSCPEGETGQDIAERLSNFYTPQ